MKNYKKFFYAAAVVAIIFSLISTTFAAQKISDFDRADKLVAAGKIPMYVRDKGKFVYNSNYNIIGIKGYNVNLRSQPNTKSNVIVQLSDNEPEKWPVYLGEWTHPDGSRWFVGEYRAGGKTKTVWIFGQYAQPMTKEEYSDAKKSNTRLSDSEYKQMLKNSDFAAADQALNQAWKNADSSLSEKDFAALQKSQMAWIKRDRDKEAKALLETMSRVEAYTAVTNSRAEYINQYVNGITDLSTAEHYDNNENISENIYNDVPDDLPSDLPDDVPDNSNSHNKKSASKAKKTVNLNSSDDAADFLAERLIELGKIEPNEMLEYLSDVEISGKKCFEFSASFNFNETGRYAVSQNGDIYEYDGTNFVSVR